jgi:two-component system chemotaxis response regulator CheY
MMRTILAVDDSTSMRQMVGHVLREAGFRVLEASDGEEPSSSRSASAWTP